MRGLLGYIFFFTCGLVAAGVYFYQLHPEHSIESDLSHMRRSVDDALERGKRFQEAWDKSARDSDKPAESATHK
jgi:hypothetical protein